MARVNIEDSLFKDGPFTKLMIKLGSRRAALGAFVEAVIVAQRFWAMGKRPIPMPVFQREDLAPELIETGIAELRDNGDFVYVRGSEEQFAWLVQRSEAGKIGGIASGESRREIIDEKTKRNEAEASETKRGEASYSSSSSFSFSSSSSNSKKEDKSSASALPPLAKIWNEYRGNLPAVEKCGSDRKRKADARWRENPSTEFWADCIKRVRESSFCMGDNNRGWVANFDWLIRPETANKIREGQYSGKPALQKRAPFDYKKEWERLALEAENAAHIEDAEAV